jgi:hypothetical protein
MKTSILWDTTPCITLKVDRRFGGIYRLHLQSGGISQAINQHEAGIRRSLSGLFFNPEDKGDMFHRNAG